MFCPSTSEVTIKQWVKSTNTKPQQNSKTSNYMYNYSDGLPPVSGEVAWHQGPWYISAEEFHMPDKKVEVKKVPVWHQQIQLSQCITWKDILAPKWNNLGCTTEQV